MNLSYLEAVHRQNEMHFVFDVSIPSLFDSSR